MFLIIPQNASTLSRELIYTGLTRFRRKLVLLIEKDIEPLRRLRNPEFSDTRMRNTYMFTLALRPDDVKRPHLEALIHRTRKGVAVRSKSEVVVADILDALEVSYVYEQPLFSRSDPKEFRLPDFTVSFEGDVYYWEHLGMLTVPSYREAWARKRKWYEDNGVRSFFAWAEETGQVAENPARSVTLRRLPRTPPRFLTEAEKRRLFKELRGRSSALARRDRLIVELFLGTGIRLRELVDLDVDDVDLDARHLRIRAKGGVPQVKFLKSTLRSLLRSRRA